MYDNLDISTRVYLIYCDIGNYRHWVKESTSPEKFFSNFDKLKAALDELTYIDYCYYNPTPAQELSELCENEQKHIQDFLTRSWIDIISEAAKLKTDKGRSNKIKSFFDSLEPYKERFSKETIQMINKAKSEPPDYTLKKIGRAEKDELFLIKTEKTLDEQNKIMDNIENSSENYAWFYRNNYLLSKIMREEIDFDIIFDITRLMLSDFDYQKAARFLRVKYKLDTECAKHLYITACGITSARRKIIRSQTLGNKQYSIITHSSPCPICKKMQKKIFNIDDARIGTTYPPFCKYNCSMAVSYSGEKQKAYRKQ